MELAEHVVVYSAVQFQMMPVFGTMGPRPGDGVRLAVELLRSLLGVFRSLNPSLPADDEYQALVKVVPSAKASALPVLRQALHDPWRKEKVSDVLDTALDVIIVLLAML